MKKSIVALSAVVLLATSCKESPKTSEAKKVNESIAISKNATLATETFSNIITQKDEIVEEKLTLLRKNGEKSGTFEFVATGKMSKAVINSFKGTFTEVKGTTEDGRIVGEVVYKLVSPSGEIPDYYTVKEGKLINVSAEMTAPAGN